MSDRVPIDDRDPVVIVSRIPGAGLDYFAAVREQHHEAYSFMPEGMQLQLAGANDDGLAVVSLYATLEDSRTFFRERLARDVQEALHESSLRGDFVRHEHLMLAFRLGARAREFINTLYPRVPDSQIYFSTVTLNDAVADQRAERYARACADSGLNDALDSELVAHLAAATGDGWMAADVWTDPDRAHSYYEADIKDAAVEVDEYPTHACWVSPDAVLDQAAQ